MHRFILTTFLFIPSILFAGEEVVKEPHWWEVIGGILAIPVALLSLAYSYVLIKKLGLKRGKQN